MLNKQFFFSQQPTAAANSLKAHNCYTDLKNDWSPNAFNSSLSLYLTGLIIFLLGFLMSQIFIVVNRAAVVQPTFNLSPKQEKIGFFLDYASSSNGGSILSEFSQEEYLGWFSIFSNNRRESLISETNEPGNCWPFNGSYGYIGLKLARTILPRHFTILHLNSVDYSNAPKRLRIFSLDKDNETALLADYWFELEIKEELRENWKMFECEFNCNLPLRRILLEVSENYGAAATCVYQFKVHGLLYR